MASPKGLTATPSAAQVSLSWSASVGATSYHVKRALISGGPYETISCTTTATTFTDTGLTSGTTYFYVVSAAYQGGPNVGGESADSPEASATISGGTVSGGTLSGSVATPPPATVNLSSLGTADWAHWGLISGTTFDHKSGVTPLISGYTVVGSGTVNNYPNNPNGYTWTDGTPDASATNSTTGVYIPGLGSGFKISAPADATTRTLTVYAGVFRSQGKMVAHLSDGSAPDFMDTTLNNQAGSSGAAYSFTYKAGSSAQQLVITFTQNDNNGGNVTLQAATLTVAGSVSADFSLTASPASQTTPPGGSASYTASVTGSGGFTGTVNLSVSGLPTGASGTFTPGSVSGSGSSTLAVSAGSAVAGTYPLTITGVSGTLSHTASVSLTISAGTSGGTLSGSVAMPSATVNLTSFGTADWAHWGLINGTTFDHKSGITPLISNYTVIAVVGAGAVNSYNNNATGYTWTGGTPDASATNSTTGVYIPGLGNGFRISAPADATTRTLTVYAGVFRSQGKMVAHLSDGSAPDFVDTTLNNQAGSSGAAYSFTYKAGSSGQQLVITFTQNDNNGGNVTLQAATLQ
jgi:hypothetical protein